MPHSPEYETALSSLGFSFFPFTPFRDLEKRNSFRSMVLGRLLQYLFFQSGFPLPSCLFPQHFFTPLFGIFKIVVCASTSIYMCIPPSQFSGISWYFFHKGPVNTVPASHVSPFPLMRTTPYFSVVPFFLLLPLVCAQANDTWSSPLL